MYHRYRRVTITLGTYRVNNFFGNLNRITFYLGYTCSIYHYNMFTGRGLYTISIMNIVSIIGFVRVVTTYMMVLIGMTVTMFTIYDTLHGIRVLTIGPNTHHNSGNCVKMFFFGNFVGHVGVTPVGLTPIFISRTSMFGIMELNTTIYNSCDTPVYYINITIYVFGRVRRVLRVVLPFIYTKYWYGHFGMFIGVNFTYMVGHVRLFSSNFGTTFIFFIGVPLKGGVVTGFLVTRIGLFGDIGVCVMSISTLTNWSRVRTKGELYTRVHTGVRVFTMSRHI